MSDRQNSRSIFRQALRVIQRCELSGDAIVEALEKYCSDAEAGSLVHAALLRLFAEALLQYGRFREGMTAAGKAVDAVLGLDDASARRKLAAWTTLGLAESLAASSPTRHVNAFDEAKDIERRADRHFGLESIRLCRLKARGLSAAGQLDEAQSALNSLLAKVSRKTGNGRRERLHIQNELAIIDLRLSKNEEAISAFRSIAQERHDLLGENHHEVLTAIHNLAIALRRTSDRAEPLQLLEQVAAKRKKVLGIKHPDTLVTCSFLAMHRAEGGDAAAQVSNIQQILDEARDALGDEHPSVFQIAGRVATVLRHAGRLDQARETLQKWAIQAEETLGAEHPEAGSLLHSYGEALYHTGQLAEAYNIYGKLAEATRRAKGDAHIETLASLNNLAVIASDLGEIAHAERLYRAMLEQFAELGHTHELDRASVQTNLAHLLLAKGELAEAVTLFEGVLRIREKRLEAANRLLFLSRSNLAAGYSKQGRYDSALSLHRQVLRDRHKFLGESHPDTLASIHNLASTFDESGQPSEAIPLLKKVVGARRSMLGETHLNTLVSTRALAGALLSCDRKIEAEEYYRQIVDAVERLRAQGDLPDNLRRSLFAQYVPAYRALALIALERDDAENLFKISEQIKARAMLERISAKGALRSALLSDEDLSEIRALEREIAKIDASISTYRNPLERNAAIAERDELLKVWRERENDLKAASEKYALACNVELVSHNGAASILYKDEVFLSFLVQGDHIALVWLTGQSGTGALDLGRLPNLAETVSAFRELLSEPEGIAGLENRPVHARSIWECSDGGYVLGAVDAPPEPTARRVADDNKIYEFLSRHLTEPLSEILGRSRRLLISPDGPLSMVPFEVLRRDGKRLIETHEVAYIPSMSLAALTASNTHGIQSSNRIPMIAVGNPIYSSSRKERRNRSENKSSLSEALRYALSRQSLEWNELPGTAKELEAVRNIYDLEEGKTLFTEQAATTGTVRNLVSSDRLTEAEVILFSTHGYLHPDDPKRNAIVLAPDTRRADDDGMLTAAEIATFNLSSNLVFLSACDTGRGEFQAGEGILGLPYSFMVSGSRAVVQTLWPIFDEASAIFVERFFKFYRENPNAAQALAKAKRNFSSGGAGKALQAPAYWAPFLCYGNAAQVM